MMPRKAIFRILSPNIKNIPFIKETCKRLWQKYVKLIITFLHQLWTPFFLSWKWTQYLKLSDSINHHKNSKIQVSYRSPFLWTNLTQHYESQTSFHAFKTQIRKRNAEICECRLCKHYKGKIIIGKSGKETKYYY